MAAGQMKAGQETLKQAAGQVSAAKGDFDKLSNNLLSQIQAAQTKWVGQGGSAFQNLGSEWHSRQATILKALNDFEASLTQTQTANHAADDEGSHNVKAFTSKLGEVPTR